MDFDRIGSLAGLLIAIVSLLVDVIALTKREGGSKKPPKESLVSRPVRYWRASTSTLSAVYRTE
jgi:hypothetical protein